MAAFTRLIPAALRRWLLTQLDDSRADRFARAFHASPDWIVITRLSDGLIIEANQGFQNISGYAPAEVVGHLMSEFKVWVHAEQRKLLIEEMYRDGTARDRLVQLRRRDGGVRDCMVNCTLIALSGRGYDHAVWIARDMTEQNAIHEQFRVAFKLMPELMSISRLSDGCYIEVNDAFERITGLSREEVIGRTSLELNIWHDLSQRESLVQQVLSSGGASDHFMLLNASQGQVREVLLNAASFEARGEHLLIVLARDVTEVRRAQHEIEDLNAQLEQRVEQRTADLQSANQELSRTLIDLRLAQKHLVMSEKLAALGALVAGVAHELNTPIGNSLTVASTLEDRVQQLARQAEQGMRRSTLTQFLSDAAQSTEILLRNLDRASDLVMSFKQVAVDQTSSQRRQFQLADLVGEILLTLSPSLRKSGCRVLQHIDPALRLDSYPGPLGQALTNLINNAMLHGFAEGLAGTITIAAQALDAQTLRLSVSDDGCGIRPDDLNHVFEPFFTTRLGTGGSGLGLHITHNIVTSVLGGQIELSSTLGAGSSFTLSLPLQAPQNEGPELSTPRARPPDGS
ncbi:PAS domain S-box protein [Roseateles sp.]|jgi:PAS domain S-box-containing protein|uniref:PAS domain S-box protein n=1 Tax=Roseateles sp. TaxID=1971397 RepID=UPI0037C9C737